MLLFAASTHSVSTSISMPAIVLLFEIREHALGDFCIGYASSGSCCKLCMIQLHVENCAWSDLQGELVV